MAKEIRTIELDNEDVATYITLMQNFGWELKTSQRVFNQNTRPVGGVSYENVTYIHSETETIDFTQLTLERETKQPHYHRLVELEREFMELLDNSPAERPNEPKNILDIETWTKRNKPTIVSKAWFFIPWVIVTFVASFLIYDMNVDKLLYGIRNELFAFFYFTAFCAPVALLIRHIKNATLLKKLIRTHTCQNNKKLAEKYAAYRRGFDLQLEKIRFYDYAQGRMREILQETQMLLNI